MDTSEILLMWLCDVLPFCEGLDQTEVGVSARLAADPHCVHLCVRPPGIHMGPADSKKEDDCMWPKHVVNT